MGSSKDDSVALGGVVENPDDELIVGEVIAGKDYKIAVVGIEAGECVALDEMWRAGGI